MPEPNSNYDFTTTLADLDAGVFAQKLSRAVRETALAVAENGEKGRNGTVTIKLTMTRIGESSQLNVAHSLSYVRPTHRGKKAEDDTTSTVLHVGRGGTLSIIPDSQTDMFPRKEKA